MGEGRRRLQALEEARETLDAIASGGVDAVVVHGPHGPRVYRLEGPDEPFRTFVERMQEGALTLSHDGTILYANSYFSRLIGRPLEGLWSTELSQWVAPQYRSTVKELIRAGMNRTVKGHCRFEGPDGLISAQLTVSPLEGGTRPSCCAVVFDLREREAADEAHSARAAAEQATVAKDQFLAVLSHELRSPLNAILGWAQILLNDGSLNDYTRRAVQTIERNSRAQAQLIGDLLDISRIIAGKLHLDMSVHELGSLAEAVISGVKLAAEGAGIRLSFSSSGEVHVYGDTTRIQQVVSNLLNNAVKFSEPGGSIDVRLEHDGNFAELRVTDTGIGMSAAVVEQMFQIFQQGGSLGRRKGGLGLGLAIARQLTEAHGGTLTASSEGEGQGASFVVRLPRVSPSVRPGRAEFSPGSELSGVVALLVDDEQDNLELSRYILERAGCEIFTADSAANALLELERQRFNLIVSDIGLPDQDGFDLMREIRARGYDAASLPAIALTGYAGLHDERLVTAAGYQKHLTKPVEVGVLLRSVVELVGRGRN